MYLIFLVHSAVIQYPSKTELPPNGGFVEQDAPHMTSLLGLSSSGKLNDSVLMKNFKPNTLQISFYNNYGVPNLPVFRQACPLKWSFGI